MGDQVSRLKCELRGEDTYPEPEGAPETLVPALVGLSSMVVEMVVSGGDGGFEYEAVMTDVRVWVRTLVTRVVPSARVELDTLLWVFTGSVEDCEVKIGMTVDDECAVVPA